jgi:hypothetical protein
MSTTTHVRRDANGKFAKAVIPFDWQSKPITNMRDLNAAKARLAERFDRGYETR